VLEELDAVATARESYVFLSGAAGMGKTALMSAWVRRRPGPSGPCYHFISRAHGTASKEFFLRNLCRQLVLRHRLAGELPSGIEELQALFSVLLATPAPEGASIVIVVDGVDEAIGWTITADLFPELPPGTTVILSGRDGAFPPGLIPSTTVTLGRLSVDDATDLLVQYGATEWATQPQITQLVYAQSQGDPFYIRLLGMDIRDGLVTTEAQVVSRPTGLGDYLDRWWDDLLADVEINPSDVYDLLGILCVVKGPIGLEDLADIHPGLRRTMGLRAAVRGPLRRYLQSDDQERVALLHERFQQYLAGKFGTAELDQYKAAVREFCDRWRESRSSYPMRYYTAHLADDRDFARIRALIGPEWISAHLERLGDLRAFTADVSLAIDLLNIATADDLVELARLSLIAAITVDSADDQAMLLESLHEREPSSVIPGEIAPRRAAALHKRARMLISDGQVHAARRFALTAFDLCQLRDEWPLADDGDRRWEGTPTLELAALAGTLTQVGEDDQAAAAADTALRDAFGTGSEAQRQFLLAEVAERLAEAGLTEMALQAVAGISDDGKKQAPLRAVVLQLAASGSRAAARDACDLLRGDWQRLPLLVELASVLPPEDPVLAEVAAAVLSRLDALPAGWTAGPLIAHCLPVADAIRDAAVKSDLAASAINAARKAGNAAEEVHDKSAAIWSLAGVVRGLASAGCSTEAASLLTDLREEVARVDDVMPGMLRMSANRALVVALEQIALTAIANGDLRMAVELATESEALLSVTGTGRTPATFAVPGLTEPTWDADGPLCSVLRSVAEHDPGFATDRARLITSDWLRDQVLMAIAMVAVRYRAWPSVWEAAGLITAAPPRLSVLSAASDALASVDPQAAREVAQHVVRLRLGAHQLWDRSWTRADLAGELAIAGLFDDATTIVTAIAAHDVRTWGCIAILRSIPADEREDLVPQLAHLAVDAGAVASHRISLREMGVTSRAVVQSDGRIKVEASFPRNIVSPLTRRSLMGFPGTGFAMDMQGDVRAILLREITDLLIKHNRADVAQSIVSAMHAEVAETGHLSSREWQLTQIGGCLSLLGDANGALAVAAEMPYLEPLLRLLTLIGQLALDQSDDVNAERALILAASRLRALPQGPQWEEIIRSYAMFAARAGRLDLATPDGIRGLARYLLANDSALPDMVQVIIQSDNAEHLADLMTAARDLHNQDPRRLLDIAEAHALCGSTDEQRRYLLRAQRQMLASDDVKSTTALLLKVATRHRSRGLTDDALSAVHDAITESGRIADPYERDEVLSKVAQEFIHLGAFDRARACVNLFRTPSLAANVLQKLCAAQRAADPALAGELATGAAQVAANTTDMDQAAECWASAMLAYAIAGQINNAVICLLNACAIARTLGTEKFLDTIRSTLPFFRVMEAQQNALLGLDRAFTEIDSWWANLNPTDLA
jgi:hypothetical protein